MISRNPILTCISTIAGVKANRMMSDRPRMPTRRRDRKKENFAKSMRNVMKRLAMIHEKYGAEIYLCAKNSRWFEFSTGTNLPPSAEEVENAYPLTVKRSPSCFRKSPDAPADRRQTQTKQDACTHD
ncbi:hypothetical protein VDGL01_12535 [Verticillium dahliae]